MDEEHTRDENESSKLEAASNNNATETIPGTNATYGAETTEAPADSKNMTLE